MRQIWALLFVPAAVALSARGAGYTQFYLKQNTTANFVGEVTADGLTYKAYAIRNGERWAVLTGHDTTATRVDVPAEVALDGTNYPVRAIGNQALGGWYYGQDATIREIFLTNGVVEVDSSAMAYSNCLNFKTIIWPSSNTVK